MTAQPDHSVQSTGVEIDFDSPAKKGWGFFTKFLFWNVASAVFILLLIGCLTVWR